MAILNTGLAKSSAADAYTIDNSLRFEDADSAELSRTFGSAGDQTAWTFSAWIKRVDRAEDIGACLLYTSPSPRD